MAAPPPWAPDAKSSWPSTGFDTTAWDSNIPCQAAASSKATCSGADFLAAGSLPPAAKAAEEDFVWSQHYRALIGANDLPSPRNIVLGPRWDRVHVPEAAECEWVEFVGDGTVTAKYIAFHSHMPVGAFQKLPQGLQPHFRGHEDAQGRRYYESLSAGTVSWNLPCAQRDPDSEYVCSKRMLKPGMCVELSNLRQLHYLQGCKARIEAFLEGDRLLVSYGSFWQIAVVSAESVRPLRPSTVVRVPRSSERGLPSWALVRECLVEESSEDVFYRIDALALLTAVGDEKLPVPATSLSPSSLDGLRVEPSSEANLTASREPPKTEYWCNYATSSGKMEMFLIHFPPGFDADADWDQMARWPLLVFLHGSGGGSFMTTCWKTAGPNPGVEYAARNFVIVSPKCRWKWKNPADPWIVELVDELAKADWVDPARIYLSGVSMGGMGTWELGMRAPRRFAALAIVGAYHKRDLRSQIAAAVQGLPIYCVQSKVDDTCPLSKEMDLYDELQMNKARLKVDLHSTLPHTQISQAFADGPQIFQWLLSIRNPWCDTPQHGRCARDC